MKDLEPLVRFLAIDRRLRKKPRPNFNDLMDCISDALDGKEIAKRTLQLDLQNIRQHGGLRMYAPIVYDKQKKEYSYSDKNYSIINQLFKA